MPSSSAIVRNRQRRRVDQQRARTSNARRAGLGLGIILSILLALLILAAALAYADLTRGLPNVALLPALLNPPDGLLLQPTRLYDRTGQHLLFTFSVERQTSNVSNSPVVGPSTSDLRRYVPLSTASPQHLPSFLPKAAVALLDPGFWTNGGYALSGLSDPASHPTVAQKLVSDLLLYDEPPSLRRAARERLLAAQVTAEYGRSQVLEWYLNSADFGHYAYGVDSAAQLYFGVPATDLTDAECAVLAAVAQSPSLNPLDAPDLSLQRGRTAIELMRTLHIITDQEAVTAIASSDTLFEDMGHDRPAVGVAAAESLPTDLVLRQLDPRFTRNRITRGGLVVLSTLDYDLQKGVTAALLPSSSAGGAGGEGPPSADNSQPPAPQQAGSTSAIVLDPQSGQILAAVGETLRGQETATLSAHDPGTLLTPFIYLTAFARGLGPASLVWDIPSSSASASDLPQSPISNPQSAIFHGPVRIRTALANDYLAPADTIAAQMGADAVSRTEASFGLPSAESRQLTASLLDLASAYGIFAADGVRYGQPEPGAGDAPQPSAVLTVEGLDHSVWLDLSNAQAQPVVTPPLAYLINSVLSDESARWPSLGHPNELEIGRPAGIKLGQSAADSWGIGYTPSRVVAVWEGASENAGILPASASLAQGGVQPPLGTSATRVAEANSPTPDSRQLTAALLHLATDGLPDDGWSPPAGVTTMEVCDPSGLLPTADCPSIVNEVFLSGNEPVQPDTLFRKFTVNRETGYLATVFTPPQLVEDKVFMVIPPEAQDWARTANVAVAPTSFDAIQAPPINPDVHISAPEIFTDVSGVVQFRGTASGPDFDHYRLLVGKGLNPQTWTLVGPESTTRIEDGLLGTWDTAGLSGLYAVELQVIRTDQRIDTAIMQVTVK